jgi:hypothetical protein
MKYRRNTFKKWVLMTLGITIGVILSPLTITASSKLGYSFYKRDGLDNALESNFRNKTFNDIY